MATTRTSTLERRLIVFGVLAVVFGGILLFRPSTVTGVSRDSLDPLLPGFKPDAARSIELKQVHPDSGTTKTVKLENTSQGWTLPLRFGYAALPGSVARLLDDVADARKRASVTRRAKTFAKYRGGEGWIDLVVKDGSGKDLVNLQIGRAEGNDVFVKLPGEGDGEVVRAINFRPRLASVDHSAWIETQLWTNGLKASSMARLDLMQRGVEQPISIVKRGASSQKLGVAVPDKDPDQESKIWWMLSPQPADADAFEVQDVARAITGILVEDVLARAEKPEDDAKYGFDQPAVRARFYEQVGDDIKTHELLLGKQTDDKKSWYVRRLDVPWVYKVASGKGINSLRAEAGQLVMREDKDQK